MPGAGCLSGLRLPPLGRSPRRVTIRKKSYVACTKATIQGRHPGVRQHRNMTNEAELTGHSGQSGNGAIGGSTLR
jgi:hypothetical protein